VSTPVEIILIIAAIGYLLIRRLLGEPVEGRRLLLLPAVLTGIGLMDLGEAAQSPASIGFLAVTAVLSVGIGLLRGMSIRVFEQDGIVIMRYIPATVLLWVLNIAVRFGAGLVDGNAAHAAGSGLMLTLGAGLLAEGLVVLRKAVSTDSRVIWRKGDNDGSHSTSPVLNEWQRRVRASDRQSRTDRE